MATDARTRSLAQARIAQLLARVGNVLRAVELSIEAAAALPADQATDRAAVESIIGRVYIHAGRFDEGTALVRGSYAMMCELGDRWSMGMAKTARDALARALDADGAPDEAAGLRVEAEALRLSPPRCCTRSSGWIGSTRVPPPLPDADALVTLRAATPLIERPGESL